MAELIALRIKNFIPDSAERGFLRNADNAAKGSAVSSRDIYKVINSIQEANNIMPAAESKMRA